MNVADSHRARSAHPGEDLGPGVAGDAGVMVETGREPEGNENQTFSSMAFTNLRTPKAAASPATSVIAKAARTSQPQA